MLRKNSIVKFVFLIIIAVLGVLLCVCPFGVPASTDNYNGFLYSIEKGIDINGGVSALYRCTLPNGSMTDVDKAIDSSIEGLDNLLNKEGYRDLTIVRQGDDKVRFEIAGAKDTDDIFYNLENYKEFSMTTEKLSDTITTSKVYVNSEDISTAYPEYDYENNAYNIVIEFTKDGSKNLAELKKFASESTSKKAYIYLGNLEESDFLAEIEASKIENNLIKVKVTGENFSATDISGVKEVVCSIVAGSLDVKMELMETSYISPILGQSTMLFIGIASIISIIAVFAFLWVRYGDLGLLGILSMIFFLILDIFFLQAIPFITLNLAGIFGIILSFVLAVLSNAIIFEKIKDEYALGKKIHLACKGGFKKALWTILDSHIVIILTAVFVWIFAPAILKCFAITLILGALLSLFSSLAMTRYFVKIYLPINSTKSKRMRLYRDKNVVELKDEEIEMKDEEVEIIDEDKADSIIGGGINE